LSNTGLSKPSIFKKQHFSKRGENMDQEVTHQLMATAERLASAAETLDRVLGKLDAQQEALNTKVDRIVAAVEDREIEAADRGNARPGKLEERVAELEKANNDLKAQAARMARKTLSPLVTALLSKSSTEPGDKLDPATLDQTMRALSVEQRIAVKAEMARAGMIE
jgi:predicted RNase H-like nuclease (RuvC/YqgF family)